MSSSILSTYTDGPNLLVKDIVIKEDFKLLFDDLNRNVKLRDMNGGNVTFEPEGTSGGGILYNFNDPELKFYKSFRFGFHTFSANSWPFIGPSKSEAWGVECAQDIVHPTHRVRPPYHTTLKAFYGAPLFTLAELRLICNILGDHGIRTSKMPLARSLTTDTAICDDPRRL